MAASEFWNMIWYICYGGVGGDIHSDSDYFTMILQLFYNYFNIFSILFYDNFTLPLLLLYSYYTHK